MNNQSIDIHVHFGAMEGPEQNLEWCYMSPEFRKTIAYFAMQIVTGNIGKDARYNLVKKHMFKTINNSKKINKTVLLAMDSVYDDQGKQYLRGENNKTHLYASNQCIANLCKENSRVLFGASIHPFRKDWKKELAYCIENGAVLCKWIPSSMMINPADPKCIPFFKALANHNLPLLWHCGPEYAIPTSNKKCNEFNRPRYIINALDNGVTVIVAHVALPYFPTDKDNDFKELIKFFRAATNKPKWKLFVDLSALCTAHRGKFLNTIFKEIPQEKMIAGSDYPIPLSDFVHTEDMNLAERLKFLFKTMFMKNPLDKNVSLLQAMGFEDTVFYNASALFDKIKR